MYAIKMAYYAVDVATFVVKARSAYIASAKHIIDSCHQDC